MEYAIIADLVKKAMQRDLFIKKASSIYIKNEEEEIIINTRPDNLYIITSNGGKISIDLTEKQKHQWECLQDEIDDYVKRKAVRFVDSFFNQSKKEVSIDELDDQEDN